MVELDKCFNPSNYLISPFNSTEAFIEGLYFLTGHQEEIKRHILNLSIGMEPCYISIQGSAGTGKTLLTYDIAKHYINDSQKVIIFHCGQLNTGHYKLKMDYDWKIPPIKDISKYELSSYDLIIIDEVQRIHKHQLDLIIDKLKETRLKCIFSYDSKQCLANWEIKNNIPYYISDKLNPNAFKLTEKIRTNKEIASFIKNLMNVNKINTEQVYKNIEIQYFSSHEDANKYVLLLKNQDWKKINYTPSQYTKYPYDRYIKFGEDTAHNVIGQEYDKVVAIIDSHFYYKEDGDLSTKNYQNRPYYHPTKMLFQILTRTKKKLFIIIINNERMLDKVLKILK